MVNVGFDAKWYFQGPPSGQVVVKNLVDLLINRPLPFMLYLFVDDQYREQAQTLERENVIIVPIRARPNLFSNVFIIPYWIKKLNLDIVFFQNFASLWPVSTKKIVCVLDVLFLDFPEFFTKKELAYFSPMRFLAQRADYLFTISKSEKDRFIKHKLGHDATIGVLYLGINKKFKPLAEYTPERIAEIELKYNLPERYILSVGRINIRKNLINLVKSLPFLKDKAISLVIVGKADHKNVAIAPYIEKYNLQDRIQFTGFVPDEDLYLIYARSTLFCFPSYAEGFGFPPLEAMSCGVPTVVSDRTSLPEICGLAATYVNPDEPEDIADKIDLLLHDDDYYQAKRHLSLLQSADFTWEKATDKIIERINVMAGLRTVEITA
ncbi:glycosyltransferase family 4 protein [Spirosoma utsteinense]|uniref:Glycosyltransferase involved in cell wall biosynthesis n=1 Tax=Spirosoma utsteinense TaxID=2585773 RepID=A0ABR6WA24_9BACT|nr:glycosyltransferase family 1 protein [Spirosoma utsteinense]MBC3787412.1 glycosyltransferase involved in cell wall biosynthesis [Spirosoma utsteinense]MBC3793033.1 glycosyltransferase involved in cell wall biosynthesis [Spirosoma utsteinense]